MHFIDEVEIDGLISNILEKGEVENDNIDYKNIINLKQDITLE